MKRWYKSTRLYGFTFQKTVVVIAVSTLHDQKMVQIALLMRIVRTYCFRSTTFIAERKLLCTDRLLNDNVNILDFAASSVRIFSG